MPVKTVVLSVNSTWNVANFRGGLVVGFQEAGYRVLVLTPDDSHVERVRALGCEWIELPMDAKGINPFADVLLFVRYWRVLRRLWPAAFLGFTIKPNVYGSLAAAALGVPVINNIAGLGTTFMRAGWLNWVAKTLYRLALRRSKCVFFQNEDDRALFEQAGLVARERTRLLPGSGVDLARFAPRAAPTVDRPPVFLMSARLLWDKGVREYIEAARILKLRGIECDVRLLGFLDVANPSAVPREQVEAWQQEGVVNYLGETDDVRPILAEADIVVLPSYYPEGTPRSLLEAAAMGKPIITTDAPGCRDVVRDGVNGYLVPVRDAQALADALARFAALPVDKRLAMGRASREWVEQRYDERFVIRAYIDALAAVCGPPEQP